MVKDNSKVAMIQISLDRGKREAEGWAVSDKLPWYTVLPNEIERFMVFKSTRSVPEYALVTKDGKRIGSGNEVFEQVKKLTQ